MICMDATTLHTTVWICPDCYHKRASLVPLVSVIGPTVYKLPSGEEIGRGRTGDQFCARCGWSNDDADTGAM